MLHKLPPPREGPRRLIRRLDGQVLYRFICGIASVIMVGLWFAVKAEGETVDPLWARVLVAAAPGALAVLPSFSRFVRDHFGVLFGAVLCGAMLWVLAIASADQFSGATSIGALFAYFCISLAFGANPEQRRRLNFFFALTLVMTAVTLVLSDGGAIGKPYFASMMVSATVVLYVALNKRIQAEMDLRESEARNRAVWEQTSDGVFLFDAESLQMIEANRAFCRMIGCTQAKLEAFALRDFMTEDEEAIRASVQKVREHGRRFLGEAVYAHQDGSLVNVEMSADLISYANHEAVCVVVRDVRKRRETQRALQEAKRQAEKALQIKTALLNSVGHEIRTPLAGIMGFADLLSEELGEGTQSEFAQFIGQSGRRLQETLDSVMHLARLESGKAALQCEATDLKPEVEEVVKLLTPTAREKELALHATADSANHYALVERAAFRRVLYNLIGNAIKFTEKGSVTVALHAEEEHIAVQVIDTGIGMKTDFLPQAFEAYEQHAERGEASSDGIGLGLAITKRLVDMMEGSVQVSSAPGEGTTFAVRFPRVPAPETGSEAKPDAATRLKLDS